MAMAKSSEDKNANIISKENTTKLKDKDDALLDGYLMIDVGANLTNKKFSRDLDSVISRAQNAGVRKIIATGINLQSSKDALRLTRLFSGSLYCTAGLHPHEAKTWDEDTYSTLKSLAENPEVVAIGECGLDFNKNFSPPEIQLMAFKEQVKLAVELKKPLFIHERSGHSDVLSILEQNKNSLPAIIIHCFTGNSKELEAYLKLGCFIGITGYIWRDQTDDGIRQLIENKTLPLDRIVLESDAPFMFPNTRGSKLPSFVKDALTPQSLTFVDRYCSFQRNEPCSLPATCEMIAALLKTTPDQVALQSTFNAFKVFGLTP